jgi:hypothetical protein
LAALRHPVTLSAIALLLLNDHVFKRTFPSVLTGKLSDFAGLFFFPFLLAALVGLAGGSGLRRREHSVMAACFLLTASAFALIKLDPTSTSPPSGFTATPVSRCALSAPTDLMALATLWPGGCRFRRSPGNHPIARCSPWAGVLAARQQQPPELPVPIWCR